MAGENESNPRDKLDTVERLTDDYCMSCPEDTLNNSDICENCHIRKMVDYYRSADEENIYTNPGNGKTREDVEKLKRSWESDPCWDLYESGDGFEEYHDELMAFQKECEAAWEQKRQDERAKLEALICPLVTYSPTFDSKCYMEKCAWWCGWKDACAMNVTALMLGNISDTHPGAGRGY